MTLAFLAAAFLGGTPGPAADVGPFVRALWMVQARGTATAADPEGDSRLKGTLFKALGKDGVLTREEMEKLMGAETFSQLAGAGGRLDAGAIARAVAADVPESRGRLLPEVRAHADALTTSFDRIDPAHRDAGRKLGAWLAEHHRPGRPLEVIVICTGNSRRSILGAAMGNIAAAYYGMPEIRFHSGGTAPTAFNLRTVAALAAIGVEVEPTGAEAPRGEPLVANPVYRVRWGRPGADSALPFEATEFSKHYGDPANPGRDFAALMVCGEADEACPNVKGAALRVSMPYLDPKVFDDTPYEAEKYAERRDDMGRLMLSALLHARRGILPSKGR